jgi:transposase
MSRTLQDSVPQLVTTREAAKILGRSSATLKRWRYEKTGPNFIQIEGRISYDVKVLLEYLRRNTHVTSAWANMEGNV